MWWTEALLDVATSAFTSVTRLPHAARFASATRVLHTSTWGPG